MNEREPESCEVLVDPKNKRLIVIGSPGQDRFTQELLDKLAADWEVERDYFGNSRPKRIGIVGAMIQAMGRASGLSAGPGYPLSFYAEPVTYFDYRQHLRDVEVAKNTRRPPKRATCSSRRRGRKFKG